jgi:outer membrane protein OmpA-like peptidoglycan-associated protein
LFSGNQFTGKKLLSTKGIRGNDLYKALRDTVSSFVGEPLLFFKPVRFEKNETNIMIEESNLEETADLLRQHPRFGIEVGAYIHSGSRISKGIENSLLRASAVKDSLVKYGIAAERIEIASPEFNRALLNTCPASVDCDHENKALDCKVEFKITETNL